MRAVLFVGEGRIRVDDVPEPTIQGPDDAIVKVTRASICGSDLHLLDGKTPGMRVGSVIGHEFVGAVVATGNSVASVSEGDRVVGSFIICCGACDNCRARRYNFCSNRRALGLGELVGDLDGAQAEYVRVPNADLNLHPLTGHLNGLTDEQSLFAGDVLTTGFYAAALSDIRPGDVVCVIGAGPIGFFTAMAARRHQPGRVLLLDQDKERVTFAAEAGLDAIDVSATDAPAAVAAATNGKMADIVVDAVGAVPVLKTAMRCVKDGGRIAIVGVYGTERYELPTGVAWVRGIDLRFSGMANVQAHWDEVLSAVSKEEVDPTAVITHRMPLDEAERGYELFASREAMKVVLEVAD